MKFDGAIFMAYMRIFGAWLPFWLTHSWTTYVMNVFDSELEQQTHVATPALANSWHFWRPESLLGLLIKYLFGFPFVVLAFTWLCVTTTTKMFIWIALIAPVIFLAFLSATRRPLEDDVVSMQET